ncbi:hypothetical protein RND71_030860 [Anisodus tanguticus]|uniref:RNA-dependent RNA polymerase n=1 Tax=Anisodus tanguticus TaxID=243964 RepID=A0AAE1V1E1_9SOLA|nr:hypothetical protein RND71_030860 [Anisodus tanguticus]
MHSLKGNMLHLIEIYYDTLDAPKSGKKVSIPHDLKANKFPHYMEKGNAFSYHSTSILGQIYDHVDSYPDEDSCVTEISKLLCFEVEIPHTCMALWSGRNEEYKKDMTRAMNSGCELTISSCNEVIKKYKELSVAERLSLTNEVDFLQCSCSMALWSLNEVIGKCGFAWKVAGSALCRIHAMDHKEKALQFAINPAGNIVDVL